MPIRRELRDLYPAHWRELSRRIRFERAGGLCQGCGRPHGITVRCLPDGRWYDPARHTWCDRRGRSARWPDLEQMARLRTTRVVLAAAHLDHDPTNNRLRNLRSLCQRCHMIHDRPHHLAQRRITYLLRRASGDLFFGPYGNRLQRRRPPAVAQEPEGARSQVTPGNGSRHQSKNRAGAMPGSIRPLRRIRPTRRDGS